MLTGPGAFTSCKALTPPFLVRGIFCRFAINRYDLCSKCRHECFEPELETCLKCFRVKSREHTNKSIVGGIPFGHVRKVSSQVCLALPLGFDGNHNACIRENGKQGDCDDIKQLIDKGAFNSKVSNVTKVLF